MCCGHYTHQIAEVGVARHGLVHAELEGDGGEDEREGELQAVLGDVRADGECQQGQ